MTVPGSRNRIRGHVLLSRLKYVGDVAGEAGLQKVLGALPVPDREFLSGMVPLISWYPLELCLRLDAAIAAALSPRDKARVFLELGRASAEKNLKGVHRTYVRAGDPHYLLAASPLIYAAYYAVGRRTCEKTGQRSAVLRTFDAENVTADDCLTVVGWHQRAIELCGGQDVKVVETQCRARGAPHCEYRCEWR